MGILLANYEVQTAALTNLVERIEKQIAKYLHNYNAQQHEWQRFRQSPAGKYVSRRVWMRHGALLEQICGRDG